jgi:GAF domain-containing protein
MVQENKEDQVPQDIVSSAENIRVWQQQLVQGVLRAIVVVGLLAVAVSSYYAYVQGLSALIPVYLTAYALVLLITFWRRVPYAVQVWVIIVAFYVLALLDFVTEGRGASARLFLLIIPFAAALFLGRREAVVSLVVVFLTMLGFAWAFSAGIITDYQEVDSTAPAGWASNTFIVLMLGTLIVVSLNYLVPRLASALRQSRSLTHELEEERSQLERAVAERTNDLVRRSAQLEAAAQVARDATAIRDVDRLLEETVRLVSARFGFYHTGIFLLDEAREYAVLQAASSEGGLRMLARGHRLRVGEAGIVGYVTRQGSARIALDVGEDAAYFDNPDLPATRSEVALPLRVRGEIIGALDVQSTEPEAFDQDDITVLQTLADQVAVAINNAQLFQQVQESLDAERRAYGELSREAWQDLLRAQAATGRRYDPQGILPADGRWREEMKRAVQMEKPIHGDGEASTTLAIPLKVRDQVIGVLDAHKSGGKREWTPDEVALLQTLVDQLGVALDSARLYEDTQRRAARERLTADLTAQVRASTNIDTILRTALGEIGRALGASEGVIHVGIENGNDSSSRDD